MENIPLNIQKLMPLMQQQAVSGNGELAEMMRQLDKELAEIPEKPQSETVYAHFSHPRCDCFVLSWDREEETVFCYIVTTGKLEMSDFDEVWLPEVIPETRVELDLRWEKKPLAQAKYEKYPDRFPKPEGGE